MKKIAFLILLITNQCLAQSKLDDSEKITAWIKTWGFLKYFHPTITHGKPSVGDGIQPDILVKPTTTGYLQNNDEILQKAIETCKNIQ